MTLVLLFISEIILLIIAYLITGKDIMRPAVVMIGMFVFSTFVALLNIFNWNINYSFKAFLIIITGLIVALLADYLSYIMSKHHKQKLRTNESEIKKIQVDIWKYIIIIGIEIITLFLYYQEIKRLAYLDGYIPGSNLLWHFKNITSYTAKEGVKGTISLLLKIMDAVAYVTAFIIINNIYSGKSKKKETIILFIPIILFVIKVLLGSGRQDLLRIASFALITSYIMCKNKVGWNKNISKKFTLKLFVFVPVALILFYGASSLIGRSTTRTAFQYLSTYAGGSIQHFNQYIQEPIQYTNYHFGEETFPGIYSFLNKIGVTNYSRPVHLEMRKLGITQGNVYTFFRRPYNDFGYLTTMILTFIILFLFGKKYSSYSDTKDSFRMDISIIIYGYLFYWIVLSSIEQYSISIISLGTLVTILLIYLIYFCIVNVSIKKGRIIVLKNKE